VWSRSEGLISRPEVGGAVRIKKTKFFRPTQRNFEINQRESVPGSENQADREEEQEERESMPADARARRSPGAKWPGEWRKKHRREKLLCVTRTRVPYIASTTLVHRNVVDIVISNTHSLTKRSDQTSITA
jgi:hypothetical protein